MCHHQETTASLVALVVPPPPAPPPLPQPRQGAPFTRYTGEREIHRGRERHKSQASEREFISLFSCAETGTSPPSTTTVIYRQKERRHAHCQRLRHQQPLAVQRGRSVPRSAGGVRKHADAPHPNHNKTSPRLSCRPRVRPVVGNPAPSTPPAALVIPVPLLLAAERAEVWFIVQHSGSSHDL